jgi:hypothetical protein
MAKGKKDWMSKYTNPSKKQFMKWMQSQQNQYNPIIKTLTNQMALTRPEDDSRVAAYDQVLGRIPGAEQISGAYSGKLADFSKALQGIDFGRGGAGVSSILSSIGGAIGADAGATADVSDAAGMVSGMGGQGGDVYSKALMGGAASRFAGLEADRLSSAEAARQEATLGRGEAEASARDRRMSLGQMLAEAEGKKRGSALNPLDTSSAFMQFIMNQKNFNNVGGTSRSGRTPPRVTPTNRGLTAAQLAAIRGNAATKSLEGLSSVGQQR